MMNEIVVMNVEMGHYPTEARLCQRSAIRARCACFQYSTDLSVSSYDWEAVVIVS